MHKKTYILLAALTVIIGVVVLALFIRWQPVETPQYDNGANQPSSPSETTEPGDSEPTNEEAVNKQEYIGLTEDAAIARATAAGYEYRIIERDGEQFPVTMDYRTDRLNFTIVDGIVEDVEVG